MLDPAADNVIATQQRQQALMRSFVSWQCRIRQIAVRKDDGRPSTGMRPRLRRDIAPEQGRDVTQLPFVTITTMLCHLAEFSRAKELSHIYRRTADPGQRHQAAIKYLAETFYQRSQEFSDCVTAAFLADSPILEAIQDLPRAVLTFDQYQQRYVFPAQIRILVEDDPLYQASYWQSRLFNAHPQGKMVILSFQPDWRFASVDPPVA